MKKLGIVRIHMSNFSLGLNNDEHTTTSAYEVLFFVSWMRSLRSNLWWSNMSSDIEKFIEFRNQFSQWLLNKARWKFENKICGKITFAYWRWKRFENWRRWRWLNLIYQIKESWNIMMQHVFLKCSNSDGGRIEESKNNKRMLEEKQIFPFNTATTWFQMTQKRHGCLSSQRIGWNRIPTTFTPLLKCLSFQGEILFIHKRNTREMWWDL